MFRQWDGTDADAQPLDAAINVSWQLGVDVGGGGAIAGFVGVEENRYADLSSYQSLVLRGSGSGLRILANRLVAHGPWKQIVVSFNENDPYWDADLQAVVLPLDNLSTMPDTDGHPRVDGFVHLNALKVDWNSTVKLLTAHLIPKTNLSTIEGITVHSSTTTNRYYSLSGQQVLQPRKGLYIFNGKKIILR